MLFRKNVTKSCAFCVHAGQASGNRMICAKKGFVDPAQQCWRFRYDPLKRKPSRLSAESASLPVPEAIQPRDEAD